MATDAEKKMEEHLYGFPMRQRELQQRFDSIYSELKEVKKMVQHNEPSSKTLLMFNALNDTIKELSRKMDIVFPTAEEEMKEAQFWRQFFEKLTKGGNALKWLVGVIVAIVILSGYGKTLLLHWLGVGK